MLEAQFIPVQQKHWPISCWNQSAADDKLWYWHRAIDLDLIMKKDLFYIRKGDILKTQWCNRVFYIFRDLLNQWCYLWFNHCINSLFGFSFEVSPRKDSYISCPQNFTGTQCETDMRLCDWSQCQNGGTCNQNGTCTCPATHHGNLCQNEGKMHT